MSKLPHQHGATGIRQRSYSSSSCTASLPHALHWRGIPSTRIRNRLAVQESIYTYLSLTCVRFAHWPQVCSPHSSPITSLDVDNASEGRFLLCGSRDCTISVYDLSTLGSDHHLNVNSNSSVTLSSLETRRSDSNLASSKGSSPNYEKDRQKYHPVARSRRIAVNPYDSNSNHLSTTPAGHSHSVTQVKWYPIDSGIFLSADACGSILLWDTNTFTPVTSFRISHTHSSLSSPTSTTTLATIPGMCSVSCMDMPNPQTNAHLLLAVGSTRTTSTHNHHPGHIPIDDRVIRLCDIQSGSISHELVGHGAGGVTQLQWSLTREYELASGGGDGCVKVFDVRKSGSGACLFTLDRQRKQGDCFGPGFDGGLGANRRLRAKRRWTVDDDTSSTVVTTLGPGNYSMAECSSRGIQSHGGPVAALSYTPDGKYLVSASGSDQKIHLWELQPGSEGGVLLPTMYLGPSDTAPHPIQRNQKKIAFYITQSGSERTTTLWVGGGSGSCSLLGYALHGLGGRPDTTLTGHLDTITSIAMQENNLRLYTGCKDGMILSWGWKSNFVTDDEET